MKKGIYFALTVIMMAGCLTGCGDSDKKSGASSEEKVIQSFVASFLDADIEGLLAASAPDEFWDYLVEDSGLTVERLLYQLLNCDDADDFLSGVDGWNVWFDEENITAKDVEIEEKDSFDNESFSYVSYAMQYADVEGQVEEVYEVYLNNFDDGYLYSIDGRWYYGPEWLLEDALEMAHGE